ncbi:MAG: WD40-repeat-containing domain protein, partial [Benniella sp.]
AYSPRGGQIAFGGEDGSAKVWDIESGDCLWTLVGHHDNVRDIAYSPRGDLVASASDDGSVQLWNRYIRSMSCSNTRLSRWL